MDSNTERVRRRQRAEIAGMFGFAPIDGTIVRVGETGATGPIDDVTYGQYGGGVHGGMRRYVRVGGNYYRFDARFPADNEVEPA